MTQGKISVAAVRFCWLCALVLLIVFAYTTILPSVQAQVEVARFERSLEVPLPDMTLWSKGRKRAYQESPTAVTSIGVLRVGRLNMAAPIYPGTDDAILDRGIGHIEGTGLLNGVGNIGLAAHRDGFFRNLKDVRVGDTVSLTTATGQRDYFVDRINVVEPDEGYVLAPTQVPTLTLVTCFPFYLLGSAPNRYVVQASFVQ